VAVLAPVAGSAFAATRAGGVGVGRCATRVGAVAAGRSATRVAGSLLACTAEDRPFETRIVTTFEEAISP
jgi:hypothetical protein